MSLQKNYVPAQHDIYAEKKEIIRQLVQTNRLKHIVVVPDGHRRWAKIHNMNVADAYSIGAQKLVDFVKQLCELNIQTVSISWLSTETFNRDPLEVAQLLKITADIILKTIEKICISENYRFLQIGRRDRQTPEISQLIERLEQLNLASDKYIVFGFDYGATDEINRAAKKCLSTITEKDIKNSNFDITKFLDTASLPVQNPDLFIRFGGVKRISGFLSLQSAYAEFSFPSKLFLDSTFDDIIDSIIGFSKAHRRFGV